MELKYYQYRLGTAQRLPSERHPNRYAIALDAPGADASPFVEQILRCITSDQLSPIIRKHIYRGLQLGDADSSRWVAVAELPLRKFEAQNDGSRSQALDLSAEEAAKYPPNFLTESYSYFWRSVHPFSQWHKCNFTADGQAFNCAEQYMMYGKATLFSDAEVAEKILRSTNPREQKQLGREVKGFDPQVWTQEAPAIVYQANKEKFQQNPELLQHLLDTRGKTIVEASPDDNIWGIGLAEEHPGAKSLTTWEGTNWLGIVLTELREELLGNDSEHGYLGQAELPAQTIHPQP
ncbi:NADAR family protein [Neolewinella lacunae]|uniref:NADAR family protein n=1 Tax=Neolewinella lacunae TaxID=1517758 RepID=A0A923T6G6_9BACT|nr:NADAR family protein [Neolewinella lacunae]MBC6993400.1 NADAR family protein [Neolewinella lacunae]MDN3635142.1 NADAR family protein [Neolewinella lacunae]